MDRTSIKRCVRCVLPATVPGLTFNNEGVCSACLNFKPLEYQGREALDKIIDSIRGKGEKYDCVVPVSGGRDSTYVLYVAKAIYGLRVLAVNYDNEFADREVRENIERACERLKVDVEFVRSSDDIATRMVRVDLKAAMGIERWSFCRACAYGYFSAPFRAALSHRVPLILWGQSKAEDVGDVLSRAWAVFQKRSRMRKLLKPYFYVSEWLALRQRMQFPVPGNSVLRRSLPVLRDSSIQQVRLFDYIPWDRKVIKETIMNELGWRKPAAAVSTWKADCSIHALADYRSIRSFGCSMDCMAYTAMISSGNMTREEALAQEEHKLALYTDEFIRRLLVQTVGLSEKEARRVMRLDSQALAPVVKPDSMP